MQQGIENAAGVVGGEIRARLDGDDDQPQDGGDPGFQNMVTVGLKRVGAQSRDPTLRKREGVGHRSAGEAHAEAPYSIA